MHRKALTKYGPALFVRAQALGMSLFLGLLCCAILLSGTAPALAATRYESGISTNASLLRMSDRSLSDRLDDIRDLGATWIRVDFNWALIQPDNPVDFEWEMYDRVVREAGAHNLKVLAVLGYTPQWAQDRRCDNLTSSAASARKCSPRSRDEFAHFAATASFRYHTQAVRGWEIWNEPNLTGYWRSARDDNTIFVDPESYAKLANAAAQQIRYHDGDAVIVTGGLAPMFEPRFPIGMRQSDYLAQMLDYLQPEYFDAVGIHPYTWPLLPGNTAIYNAFYTVDNGSSTYNLRTVMSEHGWGDKEIWATEFGAGTEGHRVGSDRAAIMKYGRPDHVTEDAQAQIIKLGMENWYTKQNVGPMFVHSDSDKWLTPHKKSEAGFGLRRRDNSKKPAYEAFRLESQQLQ